MVKALASPIASAALRICPGCGAIAPTQRHDCPSCGAHLAAPLLVHDPVSAYWVGLECTFTCGSCRNESPLNHLAESGEVQCIYCGTDTRFEPNQWLDTLDFAHAVGDLTGPSAEGRFPDAGASIVPASNRFRRVGSELGSAEETNVQSRVTARAIPGHPLCARCKEPVRVASNPSAELTIECPACHELRTFARPHAVMAAFPALLGVVDGEHEQGGQPATVQKAALGGIALRCPNCAAELDFDGSSALVHCPYCSTAVRVPVHKLASLGNRKPRQLRWWLLLGGASSERKTLEKEARAAGKRVGELDAQSREEVIKAFTWLGDDDDTGGFDFIKVAAGFAPLFGTIFFALELASTHVLSPLLILVAAATLVMAVVFVLLPKLPGHLADKRRRALYELGRGFDADRFLSQLFQHDRPGAPQFTIRLATPWGTDRERAALVEQLAQSLKQRFQIDRVKTSLSWLDAATFKCSVQEEIGNRSVYLMLEFLLEDVLPKLEKQGPVSQLGVEFTGARS